MGKIFIVDAFYAVMLWLHLFGNILEMKLPDKPVIRNSSIKLTWLFFITLMQKKANPNIIISNNYKNNSVIQPEIINHSHQKELPQFGEFGLFWLK